MNPTLCYRNFTVKELVISPKLLWVGYCYPDSVFFTSFGTAVDRASCGVHTFLCTGQVPGSRNIYCSGGD